MILGRSDYYDFTVNIYCIPRGFLKHHCREIAEGDWNPNLEDQYDESSGSESSCEHGNCPW